MVAAVWLTFAYNLLIRLTSETPTSGRAGSEDLSSSDCLRPLHGRRPASSEYPSLLSGGRSGRCPDLYKHKRRRQEGVQLRHGEV